MNKLVHSLKTHVHSIVSSLITISLVGIVAGCYVAAAPLALFLSLTIPAFALFVGHDFYAHHCETVRHHVEVGLFAGVVIGLLTFGAFASPITSGLLLTLAIPVALGIVIYNLVKGHSKTRSELPFIGYVCLVLLLASHIALIPLVLVALFGGVTVILFRHAWDEVLRLRTKVAELESELGRRVRNDI